MTMANSPIWHMKRWSVPNFYDTDNQKTCCSVLLWKRMTMVKQLFGGVNEVASVCGLWHTSVFCMMDCLVMADWSAKLANWPFCLAPDVYIISRRLISEVAWLIVTSMVCCEDDDSFTCSRNFDADHEGNRTGTTSCCQCPFILSDKSWHACR